MLDYRIEIDDTKVREAFADWLRKIPRLHNIVLRRIAERVVGNVKQYWLTGQALHVRTGLLRKSISYAMDGNFAVRVGTNVPYARIHEYGGTIVPRKGKYLAIPMNKMAEGKSPRAFSGLFPIHFEGGGLFLAMRPMFIARNKANRGGGLVLMYRLKRSVTIPRRPYIRSGLDYTFASGQAQDIADRTVKEFITAEWGKN